MARLALLAGVFGLMIAVCGALQVTMEDSAQRKPLTYGDIQVALAGLTSADSQVSKRASEVLSERPCADSGRSIAQSLEEDPRFRQPMVRRIAFEVLSTCTGEKGKTVERVMLVGLADADTFIVARCARGLSRATPIARAEAANLLTERWSDWVKPGDDPPG